MVEPAAMPAPADLISDRHQAGNQANLATPTEEAAMRQAFLCYLVQTSAADPQRQAPHDAPGQALAPAATPN